MPAASPAAVSGRSDHGQALTSVSTSSSAAFATRRRLISAVISGFSIGSPPPPPLQYDHWVTRSTSWNVMPGIAPQQLARCRVHALALVQPAGSW